MFAYFNGKFLPFEEIAVSPFDRGFLFGDGVYEAMRTYNKKLFLLQKHLERLAYSLQQLEISYAKIDQIPDIIYKCSELNKHSQEFGVYIQITRGISFPRTHHYSAEIQPNIFIYTFELKDRTKELQSGVSVTLQRDERWNRCDIKSTSLLPNIMANQKAFVASDYEAILYKENFITEGSHTSFFAVKEGNVFTAPLSNLILNGITRGIVIELCKENKIQVKETYIQLDELKEYNECFITGTTTEITPVIKIDGNLVGDGLPGNLTRKIQKFFFEFVKNY